MEKEIEQLSKIRKCYLRKNIMKKKRVEVGGGRLRYRERTKLYQATNEGTKVLV